MPYTDFVNYGNLGVDWKAFVAKSIRNMQLRYPRFDLFTNIEDPEN